MSHPAPGPRLVLRSDARLGEGVRGWLSSPRRGRARPLRQPGYHLPPEAIARSREQHKDFLENGKRLTDAELFDFGARFHEMFVAGSGNAFFLDTVRRVNALRRLLEYRAKRRRDKIEQQHREHMTLLDLIEHGRLEQAARKLEEHLDVARKTWAPHVASGRKVLH